MPPAEHTKAVAGQDVGDPIATVIAEKTMFVHDDVIGIDRQIIAGQAVPLDLVEVYEKESGKSSSSKASEPK